MCDPYEAKSWVVRNSSDDAVLVNGPIFWRVIRLFEKLSALVFGDVDYGE